MKTIAEINTLREIVFARRERVSAILRRAEAIKDQAPGMTVPQLLAAKTEVQALDTELNEHLSFIAKAKKEIGAFFTPSTLIA